MWILLSGIFFVSGLAALLFETLWFRQTGLAFGNGVWASSLVLSSFMTGLALGNGLAARVGDRLRSPLRAYAVIEIVIGAAGIALVALLPKLPALLGPILGPLEAYPAWANGLRFSLAFALLLVPSVAMGTTLPLLVSSVSESERDFGRLLGVIYGANTLGAVVGAVGAEFFLIGELGVLRSALVAGSINLAVALAAVVMSRRLPDRAARGDGPLSSAVRPTGARPILLATFLAGFLMLALEIVWFRFLLLFVAGTGRGFALMLAVVLAGIGAGSLLASVLDRFSPRAHAGNWLAALAAGVLATASYVAFGAALEAQGARYAARVGETLRLAVVLMAPVSILSGLLFTLLGRQVREHLGTAARSAGWLTLANTLGAALGPLVAGFVLLPVLGMERSLWLLSAGYGVVAWLTFRTPATPGQRGAGILLAAAFLASVVLFPAGRMQETYLGVVRGRYEKLGGEIVAYREGLTETIQYARYDVLGKPASYQLITNGYSMAGTSLIGSRYMSLFVHLPAALHAELREALLISYGVGVTASSLVELPSLERLDVVDISREILEMSDVVHGDRDPLDDPRVRVHVEDGRHFLQTTDRRFDLVTGEPPPPKYSGVEYLYTRETFELARDRLRDGGMISWWLPVYQLELREFQAIVAGFCAVFEDCSLWTGNGLEWILLGTRGDPAPISADSFARFWRHPETARRLADVGVERPEQLGALFIAGPERLLELSGSTPPLVDDYPLRMGNQLIAPGRVAGFYLGLMDPKAARARFASSGSGSARWPEALRPATLAAFETQTLINHYFAPVDPWTLSERLAHLDRVLAESELETLPLWLLETQASEVAIAEALAKEGRRDAEVESRLGIGALSRRAYGEAALHLERALALGADPEPLALVRAYALAREGRIDDAARLGLRRAETGSLSAAERGAWSWLRRRFDLPSG